MKISQEDMWKVTRQIKILWLSHRL